MSYFKAFRGFIVMALSAAVFGNVSAAMLDRGDGLIYDDVLNITWTQNAGLSPTADFNSAVAWADSLAFAGYSDWRLPHGTTTANAPAFDCRSGTQADCRSNEMGYMFYYNLGGAFTDNKTGNQSILNNIQDIYWTSTAWPNASSPWAFNFNGGTTSTQAGGVGLSAWAVRDGDVSAVPEPSTFALLGLGLAGLALSRGERRSVSVLRAHVMRVRSAIPAAP